MNPWLQTSTERPIAGKLSTITDGLKHNPKYVAKSVETSVEHTSGRGNIISSDDENSSEKSISNRPEMNSGSNDKIVSLSQEELARRAFVSPADTEVDAEFEKITPYKKGEFKSERVGGGDDAVGGMEEGWTEANRLAAENSLR